MQRQQSVDLLVIGGGIIGLSTAWEAVRHGWKVALVERQQPGSGATDVAAGMIAAVAEAEATQRPLIEFALESSRLYPEFVAELEQTTGLTCGYDVTGTLAVAVERDHLEALEHISGERELLGLRIEQMSVQELRRREPCLGPRVVGGFLSPHDRQVDPRALSRALAAALEGAGQLLLFPAELSGLEPGSPWSANVQCRGAQIEVRAQRVLVAGGAWTTQIAEPLRELPLRPVKGQTVLLTGDPLVRHVVRTPDVYIVPRAGGRLVLGASSEEQGFDDSIKAGPVRDLLEHAWRALPGIRELTVQELCVGFRPTLRDHMPAIGATSEPGLFVATGHYRHGILLAPGTASSLVRLMDGDTAPELEPFDPGRFHPAARGMAGSLP